MQVFEPSKKVIKRVNSTLTLDYRQGLAFKQYHSTYDCRIELALYNAISPHISSIYGCRVPNRLELSADGDVLTMELIRGFTLHDWAGSRTDLQRLECFYQSLIQVAAKLNLNGLKIDLDPSNVIVDEDGFLVIIDPVCSSSTINHFAFCVLFVGVIKTALIHRKLWFISEIRRILIEMASQYRQMCGVTGEELRLQILLYIKTVISWNYRVSLRSSGMYAWSRSRFLILVWKLIEKLVRKSSVER